MICNFYTSAHPASNLLILIIFIKYALDIVMEFELRFSELRANTLRGHCRRRLVGGLVIDVVLMK